MPEYMRELHQTGFKRYLATGQRHMNWQGTELTALRKNGEEFPVEVSFGEITRDGHKTFTGFLRDISKRKQAEQALRRIEAFLVEGQHLGQIGSFSWRVATDEITWSAELFRIYELEIAVPVTLEMIRSRVHPEDVGLIEKMKMVEQAREGGHDFEWQYRLRCRTTRSSTCMQSLMRPGTRMINWSTAPRFRMSRRADWRKRHAIRLDRNLHMWPG